jgi:hypothetical protein
MGRVGPPVPPSFQRGSSNRLTLTNGRLHGCTVEGRNRSYLSHSRGTRCHAQVQRRGRPSVYTWRWQSLGVSGTIGRCRWIVSLLIETGSWCCQEPYRSRPVPTLWAL